MNVAARKTIFRRLEAKRFMPTHVAEVGVFHPESSNVYDYIMRGIRCTLVEPDPGSIVRIQRSFGALTHVRLHPVAVYDACGSVQLIQRGPSTFLSELTISPAIANDGVNPREERELTVRAVTFDQIDDGTIDLLSIDIEGGEWYVIKHLVSRPTVVSIETHGGLYVNPRLREIEAWMEANGYEAWYKDRSDTVFVRRGMVRLTLGDRVRLRAMDGYLAFRRARKRLRKR